CERGSGGDVRVNMGPPVLEWDRIPLARALDIDALPLPGRPSAVAMPNPHCVFFVEDAASVDPADRGPGVEHDPLFPDRTNVEFVSVAAPDRLRMRVWERGGMVTQACGSGACAAVVAAARRGLTGRTVSVDLDGGTLGIDWREDGVWMTGGATMVAELHIAPEFWAAE
ncbi:MAG: diaminopimelate epimerase, partial [Pseudomonadota bacterium]